MKIVEGESFLLCHTAEFVEPLRDLNAYGIQTQ